MSEEIQEVTPDPNKTKMSLLGLLLLVGLFVFFYPRLQETMKSYSSSPEEVEETVKTAEAKPSEISKASAELQPWVYLVESQLPQNSEAESSYRLVHLRMSDDREKLLVDLEKLTGDEVERFDLILIRDEFGRYVSGLHEIPMKLYPPDVLKKEVSE